MATIVQSEICAIYGLSDDAIDVLQSSLPTARLQAKCLCHVLTRSEEHEEQFTKLFNPLSMKYSKLFDYYLCDEAEAKRGFARYIVGGELAVSLIESRSAVCGRLRELYLRLYCRWLLCVRQYKLLLRMTVCPCVSSLLDLWGSGCSENFVRIRVGEFRIHQCRAKQRYLRDEIAEMLDEEESITEVCPQGLMDSTVTHVVQIPGFDTFLKVCRATMVTACCDLSTAVANVYLFLQTERSWDCVVACILGVGASLFHLSTAEVTRYILGWVKMLWLSMVDNVVPQGSGDGIWDSMLDMVAFIVSKVTLIKNIDLKMLKESAMWLALIGRSLVGVDKIVAAITSVWDLVIDTVRNVCGVAPPIGSKKCLEKMVSDWATKVEELCGDPRHLDKIRTDKELCEEVREIYSEGVTLVRNLVGCRAPASVMIQVGVLRALVAKAMSAVESSPADLASMRPEPLLIHFMGGTGVGKSALTTAVAMELMEGHVEKPNFETDVYFRQVDQDFWDGYQQQFVTVYDDFGQIRDSVVKPNVELIEVIRTANIAAFPLHMASLEEKSKSRFKSKVVIMSSNRTPEINSLTEPDAFFRRIDFVVRVSVKPEFLHVVNGISLINPTTLDPTVGIDTKIYILELERNGNKSRFTNFGAMIKAMRRRLKEKLTRFTHIRRQLQNYVSVVPQGGEKPQKIMRKDAVAMFHNHIVPPDWDIEDAWICLVFDAVTTAYNFTSSVAILEEFGIRIADIEKFEDCKEQNLTARLFSAMKKWTSVVWKHAWLASVPVLIGTFYMLWKKFGAGVKDKCNAAKCRLVTLFRRGVSHVELAMARPCQDKCDVCEVVLPRLECAGEVRGAIIAEGIFRLVNDDVVLDGHNAIPDDGSKHAHSHNCVTCGNKFVHEHRLPKGDRSSHHVMTCGDCVKPETFVSGDSKTQRVRVIKHIRPEGGMDEGAVQILNHPLRHNACRVSTKRGKVILAMNGLFLRSTALLVPHHFFGSAEESGEFEIERESGVKLQVAIDECEIRKFTQASQDMAMDAIVLILPKRITGVKDITKYFIGHSDAEKLMCGEMIMGRMVDGVWMTSSGPLETDDKIHYRMEENHVEIEYSIRRAYSYGVSTVAGDCGAPVLIQSAYLPNKLLGIHVAGKDAKSGFAQPLTREQIDNVLEGIRPQGGYEIEPSVVMKKSGDEIVDSHDAPMDGFIPVGRSVKQVGGSSKTQVRPSVLHGVLKPISTIPAILRPFERDGVVIDPLMKGLEKCAGNVIAVNQSHLAKAVQSVKCVVGGSLSDVKLKVLSLEEAICGIEGEQFITPLNRHTSCGFAWSRLAKGKGKGTFLGFDETFVIDHPLLVEAVDERLARAREGQRTCTIWIDTLKDERRPIEKVQAGKTRVFSAGQVDYTLVMRMYFLPFLAQMMEKNVENEIAVGMNVFGYDWERAYRYLDSIDGGMIAGDFSNYDGSLSREILDGVLEVILSYYHDEKNEVVRRVLFAEITESLHLCRGNVYQWTHSLPSGNMMTAIVNCLYQMISTRMMWLKIMEEDAPVLANMSAFARMVRPLFYGDDNIIAVPHLIADIFNQETLTRAYCSIGMTYTLEDKSGAEGVGLRHLSDVSFLKRKFRREDDIGRVVAPRELDSVLESLSWVRGGLNTRLITSQVVSAVVAELSLHGREVFTELVPRIQWQCAQRDLRVEILTYEEYLYMDLSIILGE